MEEVGGETGGAIEVGGAGGAGEDAAELGLEVDLGDKDVRGGDGE